jgi:hypothetical protein
MRKRIIDPIKQKISIPDQDWLDIENLAQVEVTSEAAEYPVESALLPNKGSGWRAAQPGKQLIRLIFDEPLSLKRVLLVFTENKYERAQEFVLRWSADGGRTFREIVRQQWNFNPQTSMSEVEDYKVNLSAVTVLELEIVPDRSDGDAPASLEQLRLA